MKKPCEVVLLTPHKETRRRILEAGGISNSVTEWSAGGDETLADSCRRLAR